MFLIIIMLVVLFGLMTLAPYLIKEVNKFIFSRLGTVRNVKLSPTPILNRILQ